MTALPTPDAVKDVWGSQLNTWLLNGHNADGSNSGASNTSDLVLTSDSDVSGAGDLVFKTGTTERLRISATTKGSTIPASVSADTGIVVPLAISRFMSHNNTAGDFSGDGATDFAVLTVSNTGDSSATNGVQTVGVYGFSANQGTQAPNGTGAGPDAAGIYGGGYITNGGTGTGIGGFFVAQRTPSAGAGILTAVEAAVNNQHNAASYNPTSVADTALWLNNESTNQAGSAILIGPANTSNKFDVGIGFMGGTSGAIVNASIRDDGNAVTSLLIKGSHTYGLDFVGGTFSGAPIRLPNSAGIYARNAAGTADVNVLYLDSSGNVALAPSGETTIIGGSVQFADGAQIAFGGTTGTKIGNASNDKLAFFGATPIVQPTAVGTATGYTAGSTAGTFHTDDKYTGNTGTTAYTINGIVAALKNLGLLVS